MFFALGRMNVDDVRYTAATYEANARAGWGVDAFYTGGLTYQESLQRLAPGDLGGNIFSSYVVTGGFNPAGAYTTNQAAGRGIYPTAPTQYFEGTQPQNGATNQTESGTDKATELLGIGKDELIKGGLILVGVLIISSLAK